MAQPVNDNMREMGMVETVVTDIREAYGETWFDRGQEEFWSVVLSRFAADVVDRTLPTDAQAREEVIARAKALGINLAILPPPAESI